MCCVSSRSECLFQVIDLKKSAKSKKVTVRNCFEVNASGLVCFLSALALDHQCLAFHENTPIKPKAKIKNYACYFM